MAIIAGAVIGAVTAIGGAVSSSQRAARQRNASMNALHMRANNAQANMMLATAQKSGASLHQMMLSTMGDAPRGVPPWMAGGPAGSGPAMA